MYWAGFSWSEELNPVIQFLGPIVGFDIALPLWEILLVFLFYAIGVLSDRQWPRISTSFSKILGLFAVAQTGAVFSNLSIGLLLWLMR